MTTATLIQHYSHLNGKSISIEKLKDFRVQIEKHIDHVGHGPKMTDLKKVYEQVCKGIKFMIAEKITEGDIELKPQKHSIKNKQRPENNSLENIKYGLEKGLPIGEKSLDGLGFTKDGQTKIYDMITDMVQKTMKKDGLFWRKKWDSGQVLNARSYPTNRGYNGANWFILTLIANMNFGYSSPFFMTFKGAKAKGGSVRKKAEGWPVVYYSRVYKLNGERISDEKFESLSADERKKVDVLPFIQYYSVFNGQDIEGIEFPKTKYMLEIQKRSEFERLEVAEAIIANMPNRPDIDHGNRTAHFIPNTDKIDMPDKKAFDNAQDYYSVLFHELIHSTGHKSRLNRTMTGDENSKEYCFEELIAELGASYLCAEAGILYHTLNDTATYVKHYSAKLEEIMKDDNKFFLKAAAAAQKAADYILKRTEGVGRIKETPKQEKKIAEVLHKFKEKKLKTPQGKTVKKKKQATAIALRDASVPKKETNYFETALSKVPDDVKKKVDRQFAKDDKKFGQKLSKNLNGIFDANQLAAVPFKTFDLTDQYKKDFHKLNSDSQVMIWGLPGSGKTVYLLKFAQYLADKLKLKVLYVANEELGRSTFAEKIKTFNIGSPNLKFAKNVNDEMLDQFDAILFDSVNSTGMTLDDYRSMVNRHPGKLYIPIVQSTKDGDFRGGKDWEHEVDIAGEIVNRRLVLRKNRLDPDNNAKAKKLMTEDAIEEAKRKNEIKLAVKSGLGKNIEPKKKAA